MGSATILIVEDEPAIAENIRFALETEGFATRWHALGATVLSLLAGETIDLIVLDVGLPDINGFDLCKAVRQRYAIPVIFLTARSDEIDRVVGLEIGADDYMVKPFSPRELAARVRAVLRRTQPGDGRSPEPSTAPLFQVDPPKRRIHFCGRLLPLSRYEYDILNLLISRPGRIFSRETLMDRVWDQPEMSTDRTVDAHIKNLRKKLNAVRPDLEVIETHRGVGYALKEGI
jgi:two-component system catabolic regulation response regulator CreB